MDSWTRDPLSIVVDIIIYANYNMQITYNPIGRLNTLHKQGNFGKT